MKKEETLEQQINFARGIARGFSGAFAYYVEMLFRWKYGSRYFSLFESLFAPILFGIYWMAVETLGALKGAFSHQHTHAIFSMGNFFALSFLVSVYHNIRTIRLRIWPEKEPYSQTAGAPLPIFKRLPKSSSFWVVRLAYEPALLFLVGTILPVLHIVDPALGGYFVLVSFALFLKSFIDWDTFCDGRRDILDAAYLGPIIARITSGTATQEDITTAHLAQIPTAASPAVFQKAAQTETELPPEFKAMVTPLKATSIILTVTLAGHLFFPMNGKTQAPPAPHHYIFVVNNDSDTVSVIEGDKVVKTIDVDLKPHSIAISTSGKIYVTQADNGKGVKATNGPKNQMTDHRLTKERGGSVTIIDSKSLTVTGKVIVDTTPMGVSFSPDGKRAIVACEGDDLLDVVDATTDKVIARIESKIEPTDVKFFDNDHAIAVNSDSADAAIVDLKTNSITKRFQITYGAKTVAIHQNKAYAGGYQIDLQTLSESPVPMSMADGRLAFHGQNAYMPDNGHVGNLLVTALPSGKISRLPIGPYPFAIAVVADTAYITVVGHPLRASGFSQKGWNNNTGDGEVVMVSLSTLAITGRIPVGSWPIAIATMPSAQEPATAVPAPVMPVSPEPAQPATSPAPAPLAPSIQPLPAGPQAPAAPPPSPTAPAQPANPIETVKQSVKSLKSVWKKVKPQ